MGGVQSVQQFAFRNELYSVEVVSGRDIYIGFAPRSCFNKYGIALFQTCGWYIHVDSGALFSHQRDGRGNLVYNKRPYADPILNGSIVTAKYEEYSESILFEVNGISMGVAFDRISWKDMIYAAVDLQDRCGCQVRIVDTVSRSDFLCREKKRQVEASKLTDVQRNVKNVHDMVRGEINSVRLAQAKSTLLEAEGQYLVKLLRGRGGLERKTIDVDVDASMHTYTYHVFIFFTPVLTLSGYDASGQNLDVFSAGTSPSELGSGRIQRRPIDPSRR